MKFVIHSVSCALDCRFCGPQTVEVDGPIETTSETLAADLELAARDDAERLGWKSGACQHCAHERRHQLQDEHRAEHPTLSEEAA